MFAGIATNYDRTNSVLSLGMHHYWRWRLVRFTQPRAGEAVLDCACGTGDLTLAFKRSVGPTGSVIGTDFCPEMLAEAPRKAKRAQLKVHFEGADALALPYPDQSFDVVSISFGIRNVADSVKCLHEMARVARPAGRVVILEFGQPSNKIWRWLFQFYSEKILPRLGGWLSGDRSAYEYLQNSSARFPCGEEFASLMRQSGLFKQIEFRPLSFGIAYMYKGIL